MPDQPDRVIMFEGQEHHFPADFTDAEISAALSAVPKTDTATQSKAKTWQETLAPSVTPQSVGGAAGALAVQGLERATPQTAAAAGRIVGGFAPLAQDVISGNWSNIPKNLVYVPMNAWAGGRVGWYGGKMLQNAGQALAKMPGVSTALGAISSEGSALNRLNAPVQSRVAELRAQGKSYGDAVRQAVNESLKGQP